MKKIISRSKEETQKLAEEILNNLKGQNVILLQGKLGAGKTTFAQGLLKSAGAKGPFTSPTFVIMKRYRIDKLQITNSKLQINSKLKLKTENQKNPLSPPSIKGETAGFVAKNANCGLPTANCIYHLDCYRVGAKDVLELGWEEIIKDKNNLVLVEWPERIKSILPKKYIKLEFKSRGENEREIKIVRI